MRANTDEQIAIRCSYITIDDRRLLGRVRCRGRCHRRSAPIRTSFENLCPNARTYLQLHGLDLSFTERRQKDCERPRPCPANSDRISDAIFSEQSRHWDYVPSRVIKGSADKKAMCRDDRSGTAECQFPAAGQRKLIPLLSRND